MKQITLKNGFEMPIDLLFFQMTDAITCETGMIEAIEGGYISIKTIAHYENKVAEDKVVRTLPIDYSFI
jgi:diketogulonate reductase-like aldo/keto reductase